jgi:hypothetical protein
LDTPEKPLEPGRRDYVWKVDTLQSPPYGFIDNIWGSSPKDVWAASRHSVWHYDGIKWTPWPAQVGYEMSGIHGFAQNNVWMGGHDGKIYHFDGSKWSLSYRYNPEGIYSASINDIWGSSPSNIYAVGILSYPSPTGDDFHSFLLHYNGKSWRELIITESSVQLQRVRQDRDGVFLQGVNIHSNPDSVYIYRYSNHGLSEVFGATMNETYITTLSRIGDRIYFVVDDAIYAYSNSSLKELLKPDIENFSYQTYGRHQKDMFLRLRDGLAHYNGENIQYMFRLDNPQHLISSNALVFDRDVFFLVGSHHEDFRVIYHGTLADEH